MAASFGVLAKPGVCRMADPLRMGRGKGYPFHITLQVGRCVKPMTVTLTPDAIGIARAATLLAQAELVAFPTETVYGLGGDARSDTAVARIFASKGRPSFNPLIVHVPDLAAVEALADLSPIARGLALAFWPGPMTLVLPVKAGAVSPLVTAGLSTVAIRVPAHPLAQALLRAFGGPIAAPSANPSGRVSPTTPEHVLDGLSGRIAAVLDGGHCAVGLESTIVQADPEPMLLRPGGLPVEVLEAALGRPLALGGHGAKPIAPGQLASHYAPGAAVRLEAATALEGEVLVGFGPVKGHLTLSDTGDLVEAASCLFQTLRWADQLAGPDGRIAFAPVPEMGLGRAINDRLRRAAAPRPQGT
jgi:L-threonylcarbamoyladenylate synthase